MYRSSSQPAWELILYTFYFFIANKAKRDNREDWSRKETETNVSIEKYSYKKCAAYKLRYYNKNIVR